ncbi:MULTISPECIES: MoaD/ThiS family protein [Anaerolinea]|uniref:MoaD/ThiS family protein n=1 Tax=Anaerolinea thermophila (strain DSM 14523 / JCM 11388 / NBRC 100420 / UNI-1) TaxID=926569 RepID=E8N5N2_ANATU|nr:MULTISPECIES: MoaD/ThiS family protein [Anaerolinea]BAJ63746.1 hypothetical protein ANT_17200 [Anaerolinea thermophila UNI-1]
MQVKVKLYATLVRYVEGVRAGQPISVNLPDGATIRDVLTILKIPEEEVKVAFVAGRACSWDTRLKDGDEVGIFSPIGGGAL